MKRGPSSGRSTSRSSARAAYQRASTIRKLIDEGWCDAISMARALVANNDLVKLYAAGADLPERPCTYCNKCLLGAPKHPMGCYELERYDGDREAMLAEIMSVFHPAPDFVIPEDVEPEGAVDDASSVGQAAQ